MMVGGLFSGHSTCAVYESVLAYRAQLGRVGGGREIEGMGREEGGKDVLKERIRDISE